MTDLADLDGLAQAELVRSGQVSPVELLDAAIERVEQNNPVVNAVITTMYDEARRTLAAPLPDGPFTGVPFLLKDGGGAGYAGVRQTAGSRYLMDYVSPSDGELTRRYKAAGLVCCGKTNLPEFGLQPTTEPEAFGPTRNPWNPGLSAGGSSGGAAAAVATRMVPMANASDSGGSIRVPASCCGVFGLKPTRSRISPARRGQGVSMRVALISENSITVSVRDSAALLDATHGPLPGDPYVAPPPVRPYLDEVGAPTGRLRVAFSRESPTGVELHPDCIAAVEDAAALFEALGHHVEEATLRLDVEQVKAPFLTISSAGIAWDIRNWEHLTGKEARREHFEANTWTMIEHGRAANTTAEQLMDALAGMQQLTDTIADFFTPYDVWLTPTVGTPPPPLGSFTASADDPMRGIRNASLFLPFTTLANISGRPAMSVPLFWNADRVPIGIHVIGQYGDEGTLFRLAAQLEQARPWADRRPPVHHDSLPPTQSGATR
ncbi:MAG TPA: amidase [Ilumatobacter sp.]|nr:amidase [Ilumatobacter sp.]